jgi:tRNA(adenine34) deaminase
VVFYYLIFKKNIIDVLLENKWMSYALGIAEEAISFGEVPIGAVIVCNNMIISASCNRIKRDCDPTAHAEIVVIREASQYFQFSRLVECDLYVTLEPCVMCSHAISLAKIRRLYFGAYSKINVGAYEINVFDRLTCNHRPKIFGGISEKKSSTLLKLFFRYKRKK